jgi:AcrR family transcriptional regulator
VIFSSSKNTLYLWHNEEVTDLGTHSRKNLNGASTMETLLQFGIEELSQSGPINFNLENVLRESGVSRGSLYHHFGSRHGLISYCQAHELKQTLKAENEGIRFLIENGQNGRQLFDALASVIRTLGSEKNIQQRQQRIRSLATSTDDESLRTLLAESQITGSQFLVDSYQLAVDKGFMKPRIDLEGLVQLTQGMFLGRALVDITQDESLSHSVNEAAIAALEYLMNPQN